MKPSIHIHTASALLHPSELEPAAEAAAAAFGRGAEIARIAPDLRGAYDPARGQYNSTLILGGFLSGLPPGADRHLFLLDVDLFVPVLTFVFGEAQFDGRAAVVSTHRLCNQFYGLPPGRELLLERTAKEILHELGHTFGLYHCRQFECVMRSSTYVEEIDLKTDRLCPECASALAARG